MYVILLNMVPSNNKNIDKIPEPTLRRLPWYLSSIKLMKVRGEYLVSSTALSRETGIDSSKIVKDLSYVNISGRTRVGYDIDEMISVLEEFLWPKKVHKAYLFGVGNLGAALLQDSGLKQFGLEVVGAFDVNTGIIGKSINGIPVFDISCLSEKMKDSGVEIGVLTVPIEVAQSVTDNMVANGIKGVWNFTPFRIRVPENIVVQNTSLYAHLAVMFNRLNSI